MTIRRLRFLTCPILGLGLFGTPAAEGAFEPAYESLHAAGLLPAHVIKGPDYRIVPEVINRGLMNHYRIQTIHGPMSARGDLELRQRLHEIRALERLKSMHEGVLVAEAAGQTLWRTGESVIRAAASPVQTVEDLGNGIQRLLRRMGRTLSDVYDSVRSSVTDKRRGGGELASRALRGGRTFIRNRLGINRAYRNLAREVGVDPYTNNAALRNELDRLAKHAAGASLGGRLAIPRIPGLIGSVNEVSTAVWDKDRLGLLLYNEDILAALPVTEDTARRFTGNDAYSPTEQTAVVAAVASMKRVENISLLLEYAAGAEDATEAKFYTAMIGLLSLYHSNRTTLASIQSTPSFLPVAVTVDHRAVAAFPVDRLRWTREVAELAARINTSPIQTLKHRELWLTGEVSDKAGPALARFGWIPFTRAHQRLSNGRRNAAIY